MFINKRFILASSSKSRYKILKQNNLNFYKRTPLCNEEKIKKILNKGNKKPIQIVKALSKEKAKSISFKYPLELVVGCDTVILFNDKIIDKAKDFKSARKNLQKLSGKKHKIISSATVFKNNKQIWRHTQTTTVKIRKLTKKDISQYLNICGKQILQSSGCYQIESFGPMIIENIKGDFFNVMGFPLFPFLEFLERKQ